jgi:hypothetical protein
LEVSGWCSRETSAYGGTTRFAHPGKAREARFEAGRRVSQHADDRLVPERADADTVSFGLEEANDVGLLAQRAAA